MITLPPGAVFRLVSSADRRHPTFAPGPQMVIDLALQRVDVTCPRCGMKRSFSDVVFSAMAIPKIAIEPV